MRTTHKPGSVAAVLAGVTVFLVGGTVAAAAHATGHRADHTAAMTTEALAIPDSTGQTPSAISASPPAPTAVPLARSASPAPQHVTTVTYTVKPGDTLSTIATWFKENGYGRLYAANAAIIGKDPNVLHPGEKIVIRGRVMTVSSPH